MLCGIPYSFYAGSKEMGKTFSEIESRARALPVIEQMWLEEAERRYTAYKKGEIAGRCADEVIAELKNKYK